MSGLSAKVSTRKLECPRCKASILIPFVVHPILGDSPIYPDYEHFIMNGLMAIIKEQNKIIERHIDGGKS